MAQIAVLTGDIVGSSDLKYGELQKSIDLIPTLWQDSYVLVKLDRQAIDVSLEKQTFTASGASIIGFSRVAGDGWQIALSRASIALRVALAIRCLFKLFSQETRIAIAVGEHTGDIPSDLNVAISPPFIASGRLLKNMPKSTLLAHDSGGTLAAAVTLA
ncbi:MAG: hypothetical protein WBC85_01855, partial [Planktotalea sp.]|uniref:hypothetical protein n=1 Tax=Planktotalea sp. TaxID=2029877 RepID=UPI003C7736B5